MISNIDHLEIIIRRKYFLFHLVFVVPYLSLALLLTGCNPRTATTPVLSTTDSKAWSPDSDCSVCHADDVLSMANPDWLGHDHEALGLECLSCHPISILEKAHTNRTTSTLSVIDTTIGITEYSDSLCLTCHENNADLITLTEGSQAFVTPEGKTINPHNIHQKEQVECYNCHQVHRKSPGMSINYCYGCHHMGFEGCEKCHKNEKKK